MASPKALIDTDTLSLLMRRQQSVIVQAASYLADFPQLSISLITRYEILRGLKAKTASAQLVAFGKFCDANEIVGLTDEVIGLAADIYADLYRSGSLIGDADILIAATAVSNGLVLVTNNTKHFARIAKLKIENWAV